MIREIFNLSVALAAVAALVLSTFLVLDRAATRANLIAPATPHAKPCVIEQHQPTTEVFEL